MEDGSFIVAQRCAGENWAAAEEDQREGRKQFMAGYKLLVLESSNEQIGDK